MVFPSYEVNPLIHFTKYKNSFIYKKIHLIHFFKKKKKNIFTYFLSLSAELELLSSFSFNNFFLFLTEVVEVIIDVGYTLKK
jgi:hypothetical protein